MAFCDCFWDELDPDRHNADAPTLRNHYFTKGIHLIQQTASIPRVNNPEWHWRRAAARDFPLDSLLGHNDLDGQTVMANGPVFISHSSTLLWLAGERSPWTRPINRRAPNSCTAWCSALGARLQLPVRPYCEVAPKSAGLLPPRSRGSEGPGMRP